MLLEPYFWAWNIPAHEARATEPSSDAPWDWRAVMSMRPTDREPWDSRVVRDMAHVESALVWPPKRVFDTL